MYTFLTYTWYVKITKMSEGDIIGMGIVHEDGV